MKNILDFLNDEDAPPPLGIPLDISSKFRIVGFAGAGKFGVVYRAVDKSNGRNVAVKLTTKSNFNNTFQCRLEHPYILSILQIVNSTDNPEVRAEVYPYYSTNLANVQLPYQIIILLMRQLYEALRYSHENNVIHRDVNPDNIMLANENDFDNIMIKLNDFGFSSEPKLGISEKGDYWLLFRTLLYCLARTYEVESFKEFHKYLSKELVNKLRLIYLTPTFFLNDRTVEKLLDDLEGCANSFENK